MNLPIEMVPDSNPPRFRWRRVVDTPLGSKVITCEGSLPASVEGPVATVIGIVQQLHYENNRLKAELNALRATLQHTPAGKKGRG